MPPTTMLPLNVDKYRLDVDEYESVSAAGLSASAVDDLRSAAEDKIRIEPTQGQPGHHTVTASSWVGLVTTPEVSLFIRPKLTIDQVMFMISYDLNLVRWPDTALPEVAAAGGLVEALIQIFVAQTKNALRLGLHHDYRSEEDALFTVRGRIRIEDQIRRRPGRVLPVEVRFDEYTSDIDLNRLLKAAIRRLHSVRVRNPDSRIGLRRIEMLLSEVTSVEYGPQLPEVTWNRLNERYRVSVELAKLILRSTHPDLARGDRRSSPFLVDMNKVFESFVWTALREALHLNARAFPKNAKGERLRLDDAKTLKLYPDLSWWEQERCVFVGDVKYKTVGSESEKGEQPDIYQMLAYVTAAEVPTGYLIYAQGPPQPIEHLVSIAGKTIEVHSLDLTGTPDQLLAQVARLAGRIQETREVSAVA